jgi:hypothetical protein
MKSGQIVADITKPTLEAGSRGDEPPPIIPFVPSWYSRAWAAEYGPIPQSMTS